LGGKPERKCLLGRPKCRLEDNIKMTLKEVGWEDMGWIYVDQDRDCCWVPVSTLKDFCILLAL
jgi:hypothetical protein